MTLRYRHLLSPPPQHSSSGDLLLIFRHVKVSAKRMTASPRFCELVVVVFHVAVFHALVVVVAVAVVDVDVVVVSVVVVVVVVVG